MSNQLVIGLLALVLHANANGEVFYRLHVLPGLSIGTIDSVPLDINQDSWVTGFADRGGTLHYSFLWSPDTNGMTNLGSLTSCPDDLPGSYAEAMNDIGHVVGNDEGEECSHEAYLWTPEGGMMELGDLPGGSYWSQARGVNNHDEVVGRSTVAQGFQGFHWSVDDGMVALDILDGAGASDAYAINDASWIAGYSGPEAVLWRPGFGITPLGGPKGIAGPNVYGTARAINELGQVSGDFYYDGRYQPFFWDPQDGVIAVGRLFPQYSQGQGVALGMNNRGQIVGYEWRGFDYNIPIIWDAVGGLRDLRTLVDPCYQPVPPNPIMTATAINDNGWITVVRIGRGAVLIPYIPGDLDENEICDLQDLAIQLSNFSRTGDAAYEHGDLDCDQDVDLQDLAILLGNFGESLP